MDSIEKIPNIFNSPFFKYNVALFKKRWIVFIIIGFLSGVLGYFWTKKQPIIYESKLLFALDEGGTGGGDGGGLSSLVAQFGISVGGGNDVFGGDNIMTILKSRRMIESVLLAVDTFDYKPQTLINFYQKTILRSSKKKFINFPNGVEKDRLNTLQDSLLFKIYTEFNKKLITVAKPDKFLNLYEVKVVTSDERLTKVFTDKLVSNTTSFYTELRSKKARSTLEVLESRVASMKGNLNNSISERAVSQDANLNTAFSKAQIPIQKQQFNIQAYGGAYGEMFKNLEIARYQYLKEIPLLQIIDPADYPMNRVKKSKLIGAIVFSICSVALTFLVFWIRKDLKEERILPSVD